MQLPRFLSKLFNPKSKKGVITAPVSKAFLLGLEDYTEWPVDNYRKYASEGYIANHVVYSCINKIASCASNIEVLVYNTQGKEPKEVENENDPLKKMIDRPNPKMAWKLFCKSALSYLMIGGNCYIYVIRPNEGKGKPTEMWLLRPDCISRNSDGTYTYQSIDGNKNYTKEQVLHIKLFNPVSDEFGISPIQIAGLSIDQNTGSKRWNAKMLSNNARPVGALKSATEIDEPTFKSIRERFKEHYSGSENASMPLILEGGLDWVQLGLTAADMEYINGLKMSTVDITAIFGVPPELIGYPEYRTYNNVREAKQQFYEDTVLVWLDYLLEQINEFVVSLFGGYEVIYNPDNIKALQENVDALWQRIINAKREGLLSPNEARVAMGYKTVTNGDLLSAGMGQIPYASTEGDFEMPTEEDADNSDPEKDSGTA